MVRLLVSAGASRLRRSPAENSSNLWSARAASPSPQGCRRLCARAARFLTATPTPHARHFAELTILSMVAEARHLYSARLNVDRRTSASRSRGCGVLSLDTCVLVPCEHQRHFLSDRERARPVGRSGWLKSRRVSCYHHHQSHHHGDPTVVYSRRIRSGIM